MKLVEITSQTRRDFWGTYECEGCGNIKKDVSGYDDDFFHSNVTPKMKCEKCGNCTLDLGVEVQNIQTKYPQSAIV